MLTPRRPLPYTTWHIFTDLVRSDGVVDCIKHSRFLSKGYGNVSQSYVPPAGVKYIQACSADTHIYLLRDDGAIDFSVKHGVVASTIQADGSTYISISKFHQAMDVGGSGTAIYRYFVRADGAIDRSSKKGVISSTVVVRNPGVKYIMAATGIEGTLLGGSSASFYLRSDGIVEQTMKDGLVCSSIAGNDNRGVYIPGENAGNVQHTDDTGAQVAGIAASQVDRDVAAAGLIATVLSNSVSN